MKSMIVGLLFLGTLTTHANLLDSQLTAKESKLVLTAIENSCGYFRNLTVTQVEKTEVRIDQGQYSTITHVGLSGEKRLDQNMFDQYQISVELELSKSFDHSTGEFGVLSVNSVKCEQL